MYSAFEHALSMKRALYKFGIIIIINDKDQLRNIYLGSVKMIEQLAVA